MVFDTYEFLHPCNLLNHANLIQREIMKKNLLLKIHTIYFLHIFLRGFVQAYGGQSVGPHRTQPPNPRVLCKDPITNLKKA